jgi:hypothetical protein
VEKGQWGANEITANDDGVPTYLLNTLVAGTVSVGATTITCTTGSLSAWPTSGTVCIDAESIAYSSRTTSALTCTDTTAEHASGAIVVLGTLSTPTEFFLQNPNIYWIAPPSVADTAMIFGGSLPADLDGSTVTEVTGLPAQFSRVIVYGAAALTEVADLYEAPQQGRAQAYVDAFWKGVAQLNEYLTAINTDRGTAIRLSSPHAPPANTSTDW